MYTDRNFKTKKAFKEAVAAHAAGNGPAVTYFQPGPFGNEPKDGVVAFEGPHYPKPHTWYASGTVKGGIVVKVK